ncbi:MAG: hypothetical protein CMJ46_13020 [Planctomyces sp.]|nr:hypothetical protein [Planctomyces sp.]
MASGPTKHGTGWNSSRFFRHSEEGKFLPDWSGKPRLRQCTLFLYAFLPSGDHIHHLPLFPDRVGILNANQDLLDLLTDFHLRHFISGSEHF